MVVNEGNYLEVMETICSELTDLMHFFHESENINYFDTQEVIVFQDKLNEFSIDYKDPTSLETRQKAYKDFIKSWQFRANTEEVRKTVLEQITKSFEKKKELGEIDDFIIKCDEENNTPELIAKGKGRITAWWLWHGRVNPVYIDHIFNCKAK